MSIVKKKLRIVLPGGGTRGSFQLGFLDAMIKSGKYSIDRVYGCSVGAVIAPFVANEDVTPLVEWFQSFNEKSLFEPWPWYYFPSITSQLLVLFKLGKYKSFKVDDLYNKLTPEQKQIASEKVRVVAWDITHGKLDVFPTPDVSLDKGIRASSSLWLAVPPFKINDCFYMDGGVTAFYPLQPMLDEYDSESPDVLFLNCWKSILAPPHEKSANAIELLDTLGGASRSEIATQLLEKATSVLGDKFHVVAPDSDIFDSALDTNPEKLKASFKAGQEAFALFDNPI